MNLAIGSIPQSFDDFSLPGDTQNSGELEGRKVNDFTKIPFYKNKKFIQTVVISAGVALTSLCLWATFYRLSPYLGRDGAGMILCSTLASFTPLGVAVGWGLSYKGYDDPNSRQAYRLQLEKGEVSALEFIYTHGWENIRRWGFFIPEDGQPLCTKQLLATKILKDIKAEQFWNYVRTLRYYKDSVTVQGQYVNITYHFGFYKMNRPLLWEAIEHKIFTEEQKSETSKEFEKRLTGLKGSEFLANWRYMKEVGFDKNPACKRIYEWLEKNQAKYEEIEKLFNEQATIWLNKMGASNPYFHNEKEIPKVSEELVKTLPTFNDGWFTGVPGYINNLNALNGWFVKQLASFNNEFKTLAV